MDLAISLYFTRPELILSFSGLILLLIAAWRNDSGKLLSILAVAALFGAGAYLIEFLTNPSYSDGGDAFSGLYRMDAFGSYAKLIIYAAAAICLIMTPSVLTRAGVFKPEYPILVLFAVVGMGIMVSAVDFVTLYIGLELNSLAAYVLASFARDDERSSEAGLKYFVLGALASGILLFGMSLIYGFTGSTQFHLISDALSGNIGMGATFGLVFILAGLAFKISAAPFHMWTPDVYEGAPTPITAFFASAPKVAASILLVRVSMDAFGSQVAAWQMIVIFVALFSIIVGALGAIGQQNIKRLLAYSSINNIGFLLIGLAAANAAGISGMMTYLAIYVVMTLGAFACVMQLVDRQGVVREDMGALAGLSETRPALAYSMAAYMFALAGIPPLFGFWGKLVVFQAAIQAGLFPLAILGICASVIGAFYYLKVVKIMFFDEADAIIVPADKVLAWISGLFAIILLTVGWMAIPLLQHLGDNAAAALLAS
ncbi:NADH-quinone oxidoreductase subunit N [Sphingorhabdus lutea]|uniref:NADH-quinone oxidoreductase subunit N n=1 Tax=Sphingorhabdus lutea TaxID=1913578 RepID=A0A1L3JBU9_9SPHN|nr:NADH-quinone oxidoreductase subunit NuoN [Sphingorhabdus lutea]APG62600.1 NADH-quinone oxidoreductase subunit N [Sphingorhabdus lutea]